FSLVLIGTSITLVALRGIPLGIDFVGGTLQQLEFESAPPTPDALAAVSDPIVGLATIQPTGQKGVLLRYREVDQVTRQKLLDELNAKFGKVSEVSFESIGPTIGQELRRKALWAIALVILAIIGYVSYAFRKVSRPIESWKYGILTIVTLFHDVSVVLGTFALLGIFRGAELDSLFVVAILTTLGYSVHDTIVVFDRTRTNLLHLGEDHFEKAVELATNQTLGRSINTSLTTAIPLVALLLFGGSTLFDFVLALLVGVVIGTYSSIFVSSPLLVTWYRWSERRRLKRFSTN
ncbi:MAG: protein translocase subunit SecF, partial [Parcubacteria group bacterium]